MKQFITRFWCDVKGCNIYYDAYPGEILVGWLEVILSHQEISKYICNKHNPCFEWK